MAGADCSREASRLKSAPANDLTCGSGPVLLLRAGQLTIKQVVYV
jgi:hypothetical protein